mgnify:CR=1 FL=1
MVLEEHRSHSRCYCTKATDERPFSVFTSDFLLHFLLYFLLFLHLHFLLYFLLYFVLYMLVAVLAPDMPMIARIAVGGFGAFIAGYMIKTIIEPIMEIRKGEDDDLSN